jgi:hypothetical protein
MTTALDKASAAALVGGLGGVIFEDGWPDAFWMSDCGTRRLAIEWKRQGDAWRPGQRAVAALFLSLGIPYCLARSERGVMDALEAILAFPDGPYQPFEAFGMVYAVEDDPRL